MGKTARSQLEDQIELIRREAYEAGYAAAMQAIRAIRPLAGRDAVLRQEPGYAFSNAERASLIASRPAPPENRPSPVPGRRGRPSRQSQQPSPQSQARQTRAVGKPTTERLERGSNARFVEEVLRTLAPQAVRPAEIRAALQREKGTSFAYGSIRHALGQLEARKAVEQDTQPQRITETGVGFTPSANALPRLNRVCRLPGPNGSHHRVRFCQLYLPQVACSIKAQGGELCLFQRRSVLAVKHREIVLPKRYGGRPARCIRRGIEV